MTYRRLSTLSAELANNLSNGEPLGAFASCNAAEYLVLGHDGITSFVVSTGSEGRISCADRRPMFDWDEREMRGELFAGAGDAPPALTARGRGVTVIVVGPVHAGIIEPGRFTISSGGETVIHLDAQLSYSRRGVEAALEGMTPVDAARRVARICGACSVARSYAFALAIERLNGICVDEQTGLERLVLAELERLYNHVFDLAAACAGAGYAKGQLEGLRLKERVHRLCAAHYGHRFLFDAILPGGVRNGAAGSRGVLREALRSLRDDIRRYGEQLFLTDSLVHRFEGAGIVSPETAAAFGAVGPSRRASASAFDVRTYAPYESYRDLDVRLGVESKGDVLARVRVKFDEMMESLRLMDTALGLLGERPLNRPMSLPSASGRMAVAVEGARGAETISIECEGGRIASAHVISASYRNWPVVARAMDGNIVPDFPLVNKSFNLCYACADR